jgi:anti-sigma B factor antagonist
VTAPDGRAVPMAVRGHESGTVVLTGELDVMSAPELRECLRRCIADGFFEITLDLADLRFIDSSGIAVLVATVRDLEPHAGRLVIHNPSNQARKVMGITGLADLVAVVPEDDNGASRGG